MKNKTAPRGLAMLMAFALLFSLFPLMEMSVSAASSASAEIPVLNETIVGTVNFQSFNFLGDTDTETDGTDYKTTFYYTDDFFAHSAVNPKAEESDTTTLDWKDLDDTSLATTSFDFAVASYTTNKGNVDPTVGSYSWNNTKYDEKFINAKNFLEKCKFEDFRNYEYTVKPSQDSIGCVIGHKGITVYDETTGENRSFNLVAVGIRGAGYGAEWASNLTIGDPTDPENVQRHRGFDESAKIVCDRINQYTTQHGITENVKYWVVGYSRAAAVANLTAGYLTDETEKYHTSIDHVYGYTFEAPQGAFIEEPVDSYTNIHNIINAMDAVPKVSPDKFEHKRLGYDYRMPYYGNTDRNTSENDYYYNLMYDILETIAVKKQSDGKRDPLLIAADPSNYPYDSPMTIYNMTVLQLFGDALANRLKENFGTVEYNTHESNYLGDLYIDQFIDNLIDVFLVSGAWDRGSTPPTQNVELAHRARFIQNYQEDFRTLFWYFLDYSGPAFMGLINDVFAAVQDRLAFTFNLNTLANLSKNYYFAWAFYNFYNYPNESYDGTASRLLRLQRLFWPNSWKNKSTKDVMINEAKNMVVEVVDEITADYDHVQNNGGTGITRNEMHAALEHLTEIVIDLYADELSLYSSQYFGSTLHYINEILCTHEQEEVLSWLMALDPNHINRGYRTITVPANTNVTMYEARTKYNESLETSCIPVVAEFSSGEMTQSLDQRIRVIDNDNDGTMTIRYPAMLDIRTEVSPADGDIADLGLRVEDYMTNSETKDVSAGEDQYGEGFDPNHYTRITEDGSKTNAQEINDEYDDAVLLKKAETLQILANGTSSYNNGNPGDSDVYSVKSSYVKLAFLSTSLNGSIELNYYMEMSEDIAADESAYMEFNFTSGVNFTDTEVPLKDIQPTTYQGKTYYVFSAGVAAKEIDSPIEITFHYGNGSKTYVPSKDYTVKDYCDVIIANEATYGAEAVTLAKAILNYGGYSQVYHDASTPESKLANRDLSEADRALPDVALGDEYAAVQEGACSGITYRGSRVMTTTETEIRYYFNVTDGEESDYTFTADGKEVTLVRNDKDATGPYISVAGIRAKDMDKSHVITVTKDGETFTVTTSVFSSIKKIVEETQTYTEDARNLMKAMYDYSMKAKAYFEA